jgi:DNA-binding MarR family transcriptional regulator
VAAVSDEPVTPLWERLDGFERLFEHRTRLGACVLIARHQALSFTRLKELLTETDGSLGAHLGRLEEARYLKVDKSFEKRRPISWYRLTARGEKALRSHLEALEKLVQSASAAIPETTTSPKGRKRSTR